MSNTQVADDDDMGAYWRDLKAAGQATRTSNRESSPAMLAAAGVAFESKNGGAHLVVTGLGKTVDFWPGTGRWIERKTNAKGFGVRKPIKALTPEGSNHG